jgi:hypothetical protein
VQHETEPTHNPPVDTANQVAWRAVSIALATVALGLLTFTGHQFAERIGQIEQQINASSVAVAENTLHRVEHERQADYWIAVIDANRDAIHKLSSDTKARPDPFTGTDGRELRRLIDGNERRLDTVEKCCAEIKRK